MINFRLKELVSVCKDALIDGLDSVGKKLRAIGQEDHERHDEPEPEREHEREHEHEYEREHEHEREREHYYATFTNFSTAKLHSTYKPRWPLSWVPPTHLRHPDWDYGNAL